ncbi:hypothetical protein IFT80_16505 [Pseudomonas sp. CFBP 8771]|uniref:hypothetical protein n=1 Tax=Pseudomonas sp. CFBP 8771 TaxID=2775285 RepID=UPI00177CBE7D|nr:hypothetical protein [Pseudomonas sp. CFBP 8771]MBD8604244.1 hypothetical protein [Pseudomonas sp. CFBP 8771]
MTDDSSKADPGLGAWMEKFSVAGLNVNKLYPNGRQQLELTIKLKADPGITLSPAELATVRLSVLNDEGAVVDVPEVVDEPGNHIQGWYFSRTENEYDWYPGATRLASSEARDNPELTRRLYLMNKAGRARSHQTFYLSMTRIMQDEAGKEVRYDYSTAKHASFNTKVECAIEEVPEFIAPQHYQFELEQVSGSQEVGIRQYHLIALFNGALCHFRSAHMMPAGMIQWSDLDPTSTRASLVGYAKPVATGQAAPLIYNTNIKLGNFTPAVNASRPREGYVTFSLQSSNNIPFDRNSALQEKGPCIIKAVDRYGNDHQIALSFGDGTQGRFELKIANG